MWRVLARPRPVTLTPTDDAALSRAADARAPVVHADALAEVGQGLGIALPPAGELTCRLIREGLLASRTKRVYRIAWPVPAAQPSSVILKRIRFRAASWPREAAMYRSGLLARMPAPLFAPSCLGSSVNPTGDYDLWLEDLAVGTTGLRRRPAAFSDAAFALGLLNAAWPDAAPPPGDWGNLVLARAAEWLSGNGWANGMRPGSGLRARIAAFLDGSDCLLKAFGALETVFCHQDASPLNILVRRGPHERRLALLDWEVCGLAPLGQELSALVWSTWPDARGDEIEGCEAQAWKGYLAGLERAGLAPTKERREGMRLAYGAASAVHYLLAVARVCDADLIDLLLRRGEEALAAVR